MLEPLLSPMPQLDLEGINWVVVGGETNSKMKFRPIQEGVGDRHKRSGKKGRPAIHVQALAR